MSAVYGDDYFNGGGAGHTNYLDEQVLLRNHGRGIPKTSNCFKKSV